MTPLHFARYLSDFQPSRVQAGFVQGGCMIVSSLDCILENSLKDFHVKGFDYICLHRSPERTVKLYFFDGDVSKMPEVVNPHDHRYDFETLCLAGEVCNHSFIRSRKGIVYNEFDYMTPLNGGSGFSWRSERKLLRNRSDNYGAGQFYSMAAQGIHTIQLLQSETVLMLVQHEDIVPLGVPTTTFSLNAEPPSLSGLYNKFTADQVIARLHNFSARTGMKISLVDDSPASVAPKDASAFPSQTAGRSFGERPALSGEAA